MACIHRLPHRRQVLCRVGTPEVQPLRPVAFGDGQFLDNDFWQVGEDDREGVCAVYPDSSSTGADIAVQV